jgi:hypothetical protein
MWFGDARDTGGPPFKKNKNNAYEELVEAL